MRPCRNCCLAGRAPFCHHDEPLDTTCITIPANDVCVGDYLDTRDLNGRGFIARVFHVERGFHHALHVEGERVQMVRKTDRVKVWRDSRVAEPRPIDLREDRPVRNLTEAKRLGKAGLNRTFPVGSIWEIGPFQEGKDPEVVRVLCKNEHGAAFSSGINYSAAPEDIEAQGKAAWFIHVETLFSPFECNQGKVTGQPPINFAPLTQRMAAKLGLACTCGPVRGCCRACTTPAVPCCQPDPTAELRVKVADLSHKLRLAESDRDQYKRLAESNKARYQTLIRNVENAIK